MAEYIDREKLIADLEEEIEHESGMLTREQNYFLEKGLRIALKDVKHMQCEDVVPVVRCKDCKYYSGYETCNIYLQFSTKAEPNHFCSYGKGKNDDDL